MMFAVAGVPFEDVRVKEEDWPAMKPKMPFGQMPVLEVDGKMLPQSRAIDYFVAREFELYGATNWESAQINVVGELMYDLTKPISETIIFEKDEAKKAENAKKYTTEKAPPMLEQLEGELKKNKGGDGFFVGDKISLADIGVFTGFEYIMSCDPPPSMDKCPKLKALLARVAANEKLAAYLAKRKQTKF